MDSHDSDGADLTDAFDLKIGMNVAEFRKARGLTQAELAAGMTELGVPFRQQTVLKVEKGQRPLRLSEADAVARSLGVDVDALLDARETFDLSRLLMTHIHGVNASWVELDRVATELLDRLDYLRGALGHAGRSEDRAAKMLLDDANSLVALDPRLVVETAIEKRALGIRGDEADAHSAVDFVPFDSTGRKG